MSLFRTPDACALTLTHTLTRTHTLSLPPLSSIYMSIRVPVCPPCHHGRYITVEKQIGQNANATQTIHVLDFKGTGSLPPMIILHGISSCGADYYPLVRHLQKHSSRVLALDLPGHGLSVSSLDMSLKEMVHVSDVDEPTVEPTACNIPESHITPVPACPTRVSNQHCATATPSPTTTTTAATTIATTTTVRWS